MLAVWDQMCKSGFLGNFYDLGSQSLVLTPPRSHSTRHFRNAEAAFQALKFWDCAHAFEQASGVEAFRLKQDLRGTEDMSYCGYGSNWKAMLAVLRAKFQPGRAWTLALLRTQDAFLLEHNSVRGRDCIWSDDKFGDGKNWLGLQLMLVRDEAGSGAAAAGRIRSLVNLETGQPKGLAEEQRWQAAVRDASAAVRRAVDGEERRRAASHSRRERELGAPRLGPQHHSSVLAGSLGAGDVQVTGAGSADAAVAKQAKRVQPSERAAPDPMLVDEEHSDGTVPCAAAAQEPCESFITPWGNTQRITWAQDWSQPIEKLSRHVRFEASDFAPQAAHSDDVNSRVAPWHGDITKLPVDAIMNAENKLLNASSNISQAIRKAAGPGLARECKQIGRCREGTSVVTGGHSLPAKHVIHAIGSLFADRRLLHECYTSVLDSAAKRGLRSVALCCLPTGRLAAQVAAHTALRTVRQWMDERRGAVGRVVFVTYGQVERDIYSRLLPCYFPRPEDPELLPKQMGEHRLSVLIKWHHGGDRVSLAGSFNGWEPITMNKSVHGVFDMVVRLKPATHEYKFIVDGEWRCICDQPMKQDAEGNWNNIIDLSDVRGQAL